MLMYRTEQGKKRVAGIPIGSPPASASGSYAGEPHSPLDPGYDPYWDKPELLSPMHMVGARRHRDIADFSKRLWF